MHSLPMNKAMDSPACIAPAQPPLGLASGDDPVIILIKTTTSRFAKVFSTVPILAASRDFPPFAAGKVNYGKSQGPSL
uniref:Uncharacterized protein n=1 Tax=Oryza sativa subsp. japonica TaxID=39947 RepID=Q6ZD12_ORYSJ|nr:hypothetical protein [Oryza sativa Japonica Group]